MRGRSAALCLVIATLAACGGGGSGSTGDVYRVGPARSCFEDAGYIATVKKISPTRAVFRLRVYPEGAAGGAPYLTLIFVPRPGDTARYTGDETRGNVVISGPGTDDDVATQCLLEAKQPAP